MSVAPLLFVAAFSFSSLRSSALARIARRGADPVYVKHRKFNWKPRCSCLVNFRRRNSVDASLKRSNRLAREVQIDVKGRDPSGYGEILHTTLPTKLCIVPQRLTQDPLYCTNLQSVQGI